MTGTDRPFRVLSLDGGGMRGVYAATYLDVVAKGFSKRRGSGPLDIGAAFDLIVGTSVGGIVGCALVAGVPLARVVEMFRDHGAEIFRRRLPDGAWSLVGDLLHRQAALRAGTNMLRSALASMFREETIGEVFARRRIALAITAVELSKHYSWVFKTPHQESSNHRDDRYQLVDVCLATSAAPIYRSLAWLKNIEGEPGPARVFVDGGLWANNPVLVSLIEALIVAEPERRVEVFCLGTCPRPEGERIGEHEVDRGLREWKFGGAVAPLAIDAQEFAFDNMARMLLQHLKRPCRVLRFPRDKVPAALMPYLDLDETRSEATDALISQAHSDADVTNSRCGDPNDPDGQLICDLFTNAPEATAATGR